MSRNVCHFLIVFLCVAICVPIDTVAQSKEKLIEARSQKIEQSNLGRSAKNPVKKAEMNVLDQRTSKLDFVEKNFDRQSNKDNKSLTLKRVTTPFNHKGIHLVDTDVKKTTVTIFAKRIEDKIVQTNLAEILAEDVNRRGIAVCPEPTSLTSSNVSRATATLGWKSNGTGESWEVEVVENGVAATGSGIVVTTNPYTITGLTPATSYDFYVREVCSDDPLPGIFSLWSGPSTFTTLAGSVENCFPGTVANTDLQLICPGDFAIARTNNDEIIPAAPGGYGWLFIKGEGATGGLPGPDFSTNAPANYVFDNTLNGDLTAASLPPLTGNWQVRGFVYENAANVGGTTCGYTGTVVNILFREESACVESCDAGNLVTNVVQEICANEMATVLSDGEEDVPEKGGYAFQFTPGLDGTGGNGNLHIVTVPDNSISFNSDLNGLLSTNSYEPFSGTWYVYGLVYSDSNDVEGSLCGVTADSTVVIFKDSSDCDFSTCDAGSLQSTTPVSVCPQETFNIATNGDEVIPEIGSHSWLLVPGADGVGGLDDVFTISGYETNVNLNSDLNGLLSFYDLDPLEGTWSFFSAVIADTNDINADLCATSSDSIVVEFLTTADAGCEIESDTCLLFLGGPYGFVRTPPCDTSCGTPTISPFEIWPNEAYLVDGTAGSDYIFEFCSGYSDTTWAAGIAVAIYDPNTDGAVEGTLIEYVEGCSVEWDSPFDTTYIVIVTRLDDCGGENDQIDNGFPTVDCGAGGAICPPAVAIDSTCLAFSGGPYTNLLNAPCEENCGTAVSAPFEIWENEAYLVEGTNGSDYTFEFCEGYDEGTWPALITVGLYDRCTGAAVPDLVIAAEQNCSITWTAEQDGIYIVVVSEYGDCGAPQGIFGGTDNGIPTINCGPNGATCPSIPRTPGNDECASADTVVLFSDSASCVATRVSTIGATMSASPSAICIPLDAESNDDIDDDVWLTFSTEDDVPTNGVIIQAAIDEVCSETSILDLGMAVYSGCDAEATMICLTGGQYRGVLPAELLTANTYYLVRLWSVGNTVLDEGEFDICIYAAPEPDSVCLEFEGSAYTPVRTVECDPGCSKSVSARFEVWSNEAYLLDVVAGNEYNFSFCDNYSTANWEALVTIGVYDSITGLAVPDQVIASEFGCSVTFTASEDATLIAVISQVGNCGGTTQELDNGTPVFTCNPSLEPCVADSICLAFEGAPYTSLQEPPCGTSCGTPVAAAFEVWTNEAYLVDGTAGSQYTFSICNGYSADIWEALLTVGIYDEENGVAVAESQIAWEFGCEVTFDADFDTTYVVVISEVGDCGGSSFAANNGIPTIDCGTSGAICPEIEIDSTCVEYDGTSPYSNVQNPEYKEDCAASTFSAFEIWSNEAYALDAIGGVQYTFSFCDGYDPGVWEALVVVAEYDTLTAEAVPGSILASALGCEVTFTAPSDMTLMIVASEVGECGSETAQLDNGIIELITNSDLAECPQDSVCLDYQVGVAGPYTDIRVPPCGEDCDSTVQAGFQVYGNEAYLLNATAGSEYTFEFCNGYDESVWEAGIAVAVWDSITTGEAIPGSLIANTLGCSLTFTTPTTDIYVIVVSSVGNCGGAYDQRDNGFLTLSCGPNGAVCPGDEVDCSATRPKLVEQKIVNVNCSGDSTGSITVLVEDGTGIGDIDFSWSDGLGTGPILSDVPAGSYSVIAIDQNGCSDTLTLEITEADVLSITVDTVINPTLGLADGAVELSVSGGTEPYEYEWSNGDSTLNIEGLASETYSLVVTDANGCMASVEVPVLDGSCETTNLAFTYTTTPEDCNMNNGTVSILATGGVLPYTYDWPNVISTESTASVNNVSEGVFIFNLIDGNECIVSDTVIVDGNRPNIVIDSVTDVSCAGNSDGAIYISATQGVAPYTFRWSGNGVTAITEDVSELSAGIYVVTVTDSVGCEFSRTVEVKTLRGVQIALDSTRSASVGNADGAIYVTVSGGTPEYFYILDGEAADEADLLSVGSGSHTLIVVDINECESEELTVMVNEVVGLELLSSINEINIYPNPTNGKVNIYLDLDQMREVGLTLMSYDGKVIEQISAENIRSKTFDFDLSKYNSGIYFINVLVDNEHITRRVSFIR